MDGILSEIQAKATSSSRSSHLESSFSNSHSQPLGQEDFSRWRRSLKGVLPPSYLLNEQHHSSKRQDLTQQRRSNMTSTQYEEPRKGLARRKIRASRTGSGMNFDNIGDDSDSDEAIENSVDRSSYRTNLLPLYDKYSKTGALEVPEHVDPMLGPRNRSEILKMSSERAGTANKLNRKRQRSLKFYSHSGRRKNFSRRTSGCGHRFPPIGIIDAYLAETSTVRSNNLSSSPPSFIKVAAREASKRSGFGRTSPSRKIFEFDVEEDNETVDYVLQEWANGSHKAFQTANMTFNRRHSPQNTVRFQSKRASRLCVPGGLIAVVPPTEEAHSIQETVPAQKLRLHQMNYEEVETGDYSIRKRNRINVDKLLENTDKLKKVNMARQDTVRKSHERVAAFECGRGSCSRSTHKSAKKNTPQQRIRPKKELASFQKFEPILPAATHAVPLETFHHEGSDNSAPLVVNTNLSSATSVQPGVITEFNLPLLNFSVTFDILPMRHETRFSPDTFIGVGNFDKILNIPIAAESRSSLQLMRHYFPELGHTFLWTDSTTVLLQEFESAIDSIIAWALNDEHSDSGPVSSKSIYDQAYEFFWFVAKYIRYNLIHDSNVAILDFIYAVKRLNVKVSGLFAQFHGRSTTFSKLSFSLLTFQMIYVYELYAMQRDNMNDFAASSLDREFEDLTNLLMQLLLKHEADHLFLFLRTHRNRIDFQISREFSFVEAWLMTVHVCDFASRLYPSTVKSFWDSLYYKILDGDKVSSAFSIDIYERLWFITFNLSPLYQFNTLGISNIGNQSQNWSVIEKMIGTLVSVPRSSTTSREFAAYCHACFARCLALTTAWHWQPTKSLITTMYRFFASRMFENLEAEQSAGFPDFLQHYDSLLDLSITDTVFTIFLKLLALMIQRISVQETACKTLPGLIGLVTPLNGRLYPREVELKVSDLEALENNYSLLLTLFWSAPPKLKPPIGSLRDVIILGQAHAQARILSVNAWYYLTRLQLRLNGSLDEIGEWYSELLKCSLDEYLQLDGIRGDMSSEVRRIRKNNRGWYEALMTNSLRYVRLILQGQELIQSWQQAAELFRYVKLVDFLIHGIDLPNKVVQEVLLIIKNFVGISDRLIDAIKTEADEGNQSDDSYPIDSLAQETMEYELRQEAREAIGKVLEVHILKPFYQYLCDLIGASSNEAEIPGMGEIENSEEKLLLESVIVIWSDMATFIVSANIANWAMFTDINGKYTWNWIRTSSRKEVYGPKLQESLNKRKIAYEQEEIG
ncbi:Mus7/MMS22 family-domain-containing protein [Lipomyces oligophaga]|uniref:Mus7/MMS22 family-domain-containing protein n=1 Tax=Lipomyces oligophaga TaxID=45792 RepID=UPI0034CE1636